MRIRWRNFELPSSVEIDQDSASDTYAMFHIEPFEKGFGHTIGNGLRRCLLSSIEGTAVTSVRIEGVDHEYTSIPGVMQDVVDVVLNLKGLRIAVDDGQDAELSVSRSKKGDITGKDIECPAGVNVLDADHVICTLTDDTDVSMSITVACGRGYVTADDHQEFADQLGTIAIDSNYSPVVRVRYRVEETRVGKVTNYDRLVLEIWTDGTVSAEDALVEASRIYRKHLNAFVHYRDLDKVIPVAPSSRQLEVPQPVIVASGEVSGKLGMPIDDLDLSVRSRHCLDSEDITTVGQLVKHTEAELLKVRNFGQTSLTEIKKKLVDLDLSLGMQVTPELQA
ncbi:MAG: DNA-directed RNA polymerase subunit alpha [Planctomycetota bacterium]|nr:MAG: DNA-directed RNA polymerase subunit alpha [Planctomycetota bacterium]